MGNTGLYRFRLLQCLGCISHRRAFSFALQPCKCGQVARRRSNLEICKSESVRCQPPCKNLLNDLTAHQRMEFPSSFFSSETVQYTAEYWEAINKQFCDSLVQRNCFSKYGRGCVTKEMFSIIEVDIYLFANNDDRVVWQGLFPLQSPTNWFLGHSFHRSVQL